MVSTTVEIWSRNGGPTYQAVATKRRKMSHKTREELESLSQIRFKQCDVRLLYEEITTDSSV